MTSVTSGIVFLSMVIATTEALHCPQSDRIPWIPDEGIDVPSPWLNYTSPNDQCCDVTDPGTAFDAKVACPLCYALTNSLPGYAIDPNNCAKFYSCAKFGEEWVAYHMNCSDCTFWDQDLLTCVQVDTSCLASVSVATDPGVTAQEENPLMFCIDFEDADFVGAAGADKPEVSNYGVVAVDTADVGCPQGDKCGFFDEGRLEIPRFANAYSTFKSLRITFHYLRTGGGRDHHGLISNDCYKDEPDIPGNSLSAACVGTSVGALLNEPEAFVVTKSAENVWVNVNITWVDGLLYMDTQYPGNTWSDGPAVFKGPIRNSHCPLVIGSFIMHPVESYFRGYMDDICFYKW